MVAAGILLSRIIGLVRNRVFAHYFGTSTAADAFNAAFRIPNFLQNLFGEGVLSASLIPVYAGLRAGGRTREAAAVATAVASLLGLGVAAGARWRRARALADRRHRAGLRGREARAHGPTGGILFPGAGLLALSAWCLGVLNSHRRFFLSYVAPVLWNAAIIVALVAFGGRRAQADLAVIAAWGSVAGSSSCCSSCPRCSGCSTGCDRAAPRLARARCCGTSVRLHRPRRRADQRLRGHAARQPAPDRRGGRGLLCPGALHAARESLRHVGVRGGAARDVERDRHR